MENILIAAKVIHKHKTEAEWKQEAYIPSAGEIIIYDPDANHANARYKTGTGGKAVTDLPFLSEEEFKSIQGQIDTVKVQMEETTSLAKAAQSGRVFENYSDLIDYFNNEGNFTMGNNQLEDYNDKSWYNIGNNFFIKKLEVPDMWVSNIDEDWQNYVYTSDNEVVKALLSANGLTVGYVTFSALENAKVNLEGYALKSELEDYVTQLDFDESCKTLSQQIENNSSDIDQLESLIEKQSDGIHLKSGVIYANDEELATKKYVDENNTGGGSVIKDLNPIAGYGESSIILSPIKEEVEENKNEAFSKYSTALGIGAVAGSRGYKILHAASKEVNGKTYAAFYILEGNCNEDPSTTGYTDSLSQLIEKNGSGKVQCNVRLANHGYDIPIATVEQGYWITTDDGKKEFSTTVTSGLSAFKLTISGDKPYMEMRTDGELNYLTIASHPELGKDNYHFSAHTEGLSTKALARASHAEGILTKALGMYSHVEGDSNVTKGYASHAEGRSNESDSPYAHVEGYSNSTTGGYATGAHVEGGYNTASAAYQHVQGKYNMLRDGFSNVAHIIGNGRGINNRSNAHTVDFNGNGWFAGDLYVGGNYAFYHKDRGIVTNGDVKKVATEKHVGEQISKAIADFATKEYVDSAIQAAINSVLNTEV